MKKFILISVACVTLLIASGCTNFKDSSDKDMSLEYVQTNKKLILGLDDSFPPMGFRDENNEIVGFDIDVATAVCQKLGVELKLQPVDWKAKELELNSKNIDCIWNGMSITDERKQNMSLSIPYMKNHITLVVKKDSGIKSKSDMVGKQLAIQNSSSAEHALDADTEFKDGLKNINRFNDNLTAIMDLETGGSDAVLMDDVVANYIVPQRKSSELLVLDDFLVSEYYAVGFRKSDIALTEAVNDAIKALDGDGTLSQILIKWFEQDSSTIE